VGMGSAIGSSGEVNGAGAFPVYREGPQMWPQGTEG
jgi:hypothetical protein